MRGINKVMLIGTVGHDPELKNVSTSNFKVCNLSLATSEAWKDKNGVKQERTEWHQVTLFNKLADIVIKYVKKGDKIYVEGRLQTEKWKDKEGKDKFAVKIIALSIEMLGSKTIGVSTSAISTSTNYNQEQYNKTSTDASSGAKENIFIHDEIETNEIKTFDDEIPF